MIKTTTFSTVAINGKYVPAGTRVHVLKDVEGTLDSVLVCVEDDQDTKFRVTEQSLV